MLSPSATDWTVPEDTARVARAAFPKGGGYLALRDTFPVLYRDETFAALFAARGRPAEAPGRLVLVLILQFVEGLSDTQAADAVRSRIDVKYLLGLPLEDPGFDASVLSEFRTRVLAGGAEAQVLTQLLEHCKAQGWLRERQRQRTDSTHVLAAVRDLNRLELVGETLRAVLEQLAEMAPAWLQSWLPFECYERYGRRWENYRLPKREAERVALAEQVGTDGYRLWQQLWADPPAPVAGWRDLPAVQVLQGVWLQQFTPDAETGRARWRRPDELPPPHRLIESPYDPEAHYSTKRETHWKGYKVHVTETCEPDGPHLITHVATTLSTTPDTAVLDGVQSDLAAAGLPPGEHLVDEGYLDGEQLARAQQQGVTVIGPAPQDTSWQARQGRGFALADFEIDWDVRQVRCPQGHLSRSWRTGVDKYGHERHTVTFARRDCAPCPVRAQCTRAARNPRSLELRARGAQEALQAQRALQQRSDFRAQYAARAGVEGTLEQGIRVAGLRWARYVGLAKTHLQHVLTAAALNLVRIIAWLEQAPRAATRVSRLAALAAVTTVTTVAASP